MILRRSFLPVLLSAAAMPACAAAADAVSLPNTYPVDGQTLVLNGMGIRTVTIFAVRAYAAGLYVAQRSHDAQAILSSPTPKVVLMQFLHSASKRQVEDHYREGEQRNCGHGECPMSDQADFDRLVAATPGAEVGDVLTYIYRSSGVRVLFNNRPIAEIPNADLSLRLLMAFIGPNPPSADLKAKLLGLG